MPCQHRKETESMGHHHIRPTTFPFVVLLSLSGCLGEVADDEALEAGETAALGAASTLVRRGSAKCLDVAGRGTADGTKIQQWTCNQTSAQTFVLDDRG